MAYDVRNEPEYVVSLYLWIVVLDLKFGSVVGCCSEERYHHD
jgi:hypothetical protein